MRTLSLVLMAVVALASPACAAEPGPVVQPTVIPGQWKIADQQFPPIDQVAARPAPDVPVYGLYAWTGEYLEHRDAIRKIGFRSIRIGGPFDDKAMEAMSQDGVEIMKTLGVRVHGQNRNRAFYDSDEAFLADNIKGIVAFLERYGPGGTFFKDHPDLPNRPVTKIEVWNEPNFQYMIPDREPRAEVEAEREALYAKVIVAAGKAIKDRWPDVTVIGFGAGGASKGDIRFIKNVHEKDPAVAKSYDALSTHPYTEPVGPDMFYVKPWGGYAVAPCLAEIRAILAKHGRGDAPVWYTEVGYPISKQDGGHFDTPPGKPLVSPLLQAAYTCRMYAVAMRLGVARVHIMFATDSDNFNAGFFLRDKSWRPQAFAVQTMIRTLPNPRLQAAVSDGQDGLFIYRFAPDAAKADAGKPVLMAWNVAGPKTVAIEAAGKVTVRDMFGHEKTVESADGKVSVEVGPCPVYVLAQ
ncbi:MAG TPA: hypothetical protein PLP01_00480 [Phycisphaerae bacterium]|nr:hypothetical protein [Phycisphaerae bacterium]HOI53705.1 hypothetical protein [Phycisphaerae bacterium]